MHRKNSFQPAVFLLLLLIAVTAPAPVRSQTNDRAPESFSSVPYRVGERATYNVSFANFPAAAFVELTVAGRGTYAGREGIELRGHIGTSGVVNAALYAINTDYVSFVDPATGLPFRTEQTTRDPNEPAMADTPNPALARVTSNATTGIYDLLSALYRLRALPLTSGARHQLNAVHNGTQYAAELRVRGRETVNTSVGSFNAILAEVRVPGNRSVNDYRIQIYFSDDERRLPVRVMVRHPAGEVRADLASYEVLAPPTTPPNVAVITPSPSVPTVPDPTTAARPLETRPVTPPRETENAEALSADLPFAVGEQLNYNVFLGNTAQTIGTLSFQVRARARYFGRNGLLLSATGRTTGAGARLFPVNDAVNSYVDPSTLLPFRSELRLEEGTRRVVQTVTLDQERAAAAKDDGTRVEIQVGTHDLVSVLYALRSFNLAPPRRNAVTILAINRLRTLSITSLQRETIELGGQRIPAIQISLTTDDANPDRLGLRLWVSDDRRRLPLRMIITTPFGPVRADLAIIPVSRQ